MSGRRNGITVALAHVMQFTESFSNCVLSSKTALWGIPPMDSRKAGCELWGSSWMEDRAIKRIVIGTSTKPSALDQAGRARGAIAGGSAYVTMSDSDGRVWWRAAGTMPWEASCRRVLHYAKKYQQGMVEGSRDKHVLASRERFPRRNPRQ